MSNSQGSQNSNPASIENTTHVSKRWNNDLVRLGYNQVAETYTSHRDQLENSKYLEYLVELLPFGSTVLDIGCGAGLPIDKFLIDKGYKVLGIDISEKQIELAKKNVPKAKYRVKDMADLQAEDYRVDAVVSFYAIFHTPRVHHKTLFEKINSYLPQNGIILVTMGSSEWEGTEDNFHGVKMFWSHYDNKKNKEIIERAGFSIILDEIDGSSGEKHQIVLAKKI